MLFIAGQLLKETAVVQNVASHSATPVTMMMNITPFLATVTLVPTTLKYIRQSTGALSAVLSVHAGLMQLSIQR